MEEGWSAINILTGKHSKGDIYECQDEGGRSILEWILQEVVVAVRKWIDSA